MSDELRLEEVHRGGRQGIARHDAVLDVLEYVPAPMQTTNRN